MYKRIIIIILSLYGASLVLAQSPPSANPSQPELTGQPAVPDSLLRAMSKQVQQEFDFMDTDILADVATALGITDMANWKGYLGLEPQNTALDKRTLRSLGIPPYHAYLGKQFILHGFTEQSTLAEIANRASLPIKKVRQELGIPTLDRGRDAYSLQALGVSVARMDSLIAGFDRHRIPYGVSITGVGMLIVFLALLITSIVIGQLIHLNRKPRKQAEKLVINHSGKLVSASKDINHNTIAAAITALFLYKQQIEERRRLLLTFTRTPTNQWRASGVLDMPNRVILRNRRQP